MKRFARKYILLHPDDCLPPHSLDLSPGSRDLIKVKELESFFRQEGFDKTKAALVGYPYNNAIQLLSGTHRHEAARRANIMLPVTLVLRSLVEARWGTPSWYNLIKDIAVEDLECVEVGENTPPAALADRIDLARDFDFSKENI